MRCCSAQRELLIAHFSSFFRLFLGGWPNFWSLKPEFHKTGNLARRILFISAYSTFSDGFRLLRVFVAVPKNRSVELSCLFVRNCSLSQTWGLRAIRSLSSLFKFDQFRRVILLRKQDTVDVCKRVSVDFNVLKKPHPCQWPQDNDQTMSSTAVESIRSSCSQQLPLLQMRGEKVQKVHIKKKEQML